MAVRRRRRTRPVARLLFLLLAAVPACSLVTPTSDSTPPAAEAKRAVEVDSVDIATWVADALDALPLEAKVGQMLFARTAAGVAGRPVAEATSWIERHGVGGFVVGEGAPTEVAATLNALQAASSLPLLIAADIEGDPSARPAASYAAGGIGGTVLPSNMGIAATGNPVYARLAGRILAREARAVGIHWLLAPVVDVNTVATNPMLNIRSYGSDPEHVARFAAAFVAGAEGAGAITAALHFPGYGGTDVDARVDLPVLRHDAEHFESVDLLPFTAALAAGASSVMLGHIAAPALTGGVLEPASQSHALGTALLRQRLGFDGIVVTDDMAMAALRALPGHSPADDAVRAVEAGADVVLSPPDLEAAHRAIVAAVRSGRLSEQRIDASVRRIMTAKARLGLHRNRFVSLDDIASVVAAPEHERAAEEMAAAAMTLVRDDAKILPLDPRRTRSVALIVVAEPADMAAGDAFAAALRESYGDVALHRIDRTQAASVHDAALAAARSADAVVFASFLAPVPGRRATRLPDVAGDFLRRLATISPRLVTVGFGDPYAIADAQPGTLLLAWQPRGATAQRAAAKAIAGLVPLSGRTPVALAGTPIGSGIARPALNFDFTWAQPEEVGMSSAVLDSIDDIIETALLQGAAPGAAIAIGRRGRIVRMRGYGTLDPRPGFGLVNDSSIFDLASLTKVIGTTTLAMMLVDEGLLDLDAPVARYLPEWRGGGGRERVTVRNLLLHNSGLPAYSALYNELRGRDEYIRRIGAVALQYETGTSTIYSDFGPILLAAIIERLTGFDLAELVERRIAGPLGMRETGFNPYLWSAGEADKAAGAADGDGAAGPLLLRRVAPTEIDTVFRDGHLHGRVHDENAYALGGVAGHAGLFGSARDLARFAQMLLDGGFFEGRRYVNRATVEDFTRRQAAASSRALGWDTPSGASSAGDFFSARSFGHTGFTGTSMWIDPEREVFVVLLTNRVNPTRANQRHIPLRRAIADAVQRAITDSPLQRRDDR